MAVSEGADIGAIFSVVVAAVVMFQALTTERPFGLRVVLGVARVAILAAFAMFLAAVAIVVLFSTQVQGVAGTQQDVQSKEQRWDWATQWSLPKKEALGLVIPGVFGYRMDTLQGGNYWGGVGRDPNWDRWFAAGGQGQPPVGFMRFTGGGNYSGTLVVLIAVWAALQGFRRKGSVFSLSNRHWLWFWSVAAVVSLLLAFGRFGVLYRLLYVVIPYFSTIRNPTKFLYVLSCALVILFAYGVHGLLRCYMAPGEASAGLSLKAWWQRVRGFDRRWVIGCGVAVGASLVGWLIYASSREDFVKYLQTVQFDAQTAQSIAQFSISQVGWFIVLLGMAIWVVLQILSGGFAGPRARWGILAMGLFVVLDLGRANQPWIINWDYQRKYATNPIIDRLRDKPYERRVAILPDWLSRAVKAPPELAVLDQLYRIEWAQHLFLYYNIQSLDIVQMPRMPEDLMAFETALQPRTGADVSRVVARRWELTNTRYLLGPAAFVDLLNQQIDPPKHRFKIAERFEVVPKPGVVSPTKLEELTAVPATNGNFALIEFTGALPRAALYSNWQQSTNDQATLQTLADPGFDPHSLVVVNSPVPVPPAGATTNQPAGTVEFTGYAPKRIRLQVNATTPAVLLLNDRYDPNWRVLVDGKPESLLRCNYLMRGLYLTPGKHEVQFSFEPTNRVFYVSLAAVGLAFLLSLVLLAYRGQPAADGRP
jgi:hypothetical protein